MENMNPENIENVIPLKNDFEDVARRITLLQSYRESADFLHKTSFKILHDLADEIKKKYNIDIRKKQITLDMKESTLVVFKDAQQATLDISKNRK